VVVTDNTRIESKGMRSCIRTALLAWLPEDGVRVLTQGVGGGRAEGVSTILVYLQPFAKR